MNARRRTAKTGREAVTGCISVYRGNLEDQEKYGRLKEGHKMLTAIQYIFIMTYGRLEDVKTGHSRESGGLLSRTVCLHIFAWQKLLSVKIYG